MGSNEFIKCFTGYSRSRKKRVCPEQISGKVGFFRKYVKVGIVLSGRRKVGIINVH